MCHSNSLDNFSLFWMSLPKIGLCQPVWLRPQNSIIGDWTSFPKKNDFELNWIGTRSFLDEFSRNRFGSGLGLVWVWFGSALGLVWAWFGSGSSPYRVSMIHKSLLVDVVLSVRHRPISVREKCYKQKILFWFPLEYSSPILKYF